MIISEVMKTTVMTGRPHEDAADVLTKMNREKIRHLPVVNEEERLIGIISDRDLASASKNTLDEIMITDVHTAFPGDFVEEAAWTMMENKIHCLPVVDGEDKIIGIITDTDLLKTLVTLTGADRPSSRIEIEVDDKPGMLAEVTEAVRVSGLNIRSLFILPGKEQSMRIVMRVQTMNPHPLLELFSQKNWEILWPKESEWNI
ncbi:CBS and ACT domain-containing protein [Alkalicoccus urumqiensis]|uniref:CBS domain-containing protein n=1 Tax=Alkalicoccus urumqiensis TaxID=1548213 RepID=A0A2P6MGJ5_ALKUR|nr:CBS and ACT domain-containing protein [Alkalicoccus urumqiensis]PRO65415.1 hypothetical protein C6I21_09645 [Alkalicoccus urumqiensis]